MKKITIKTINSLPNFFRDWEIENYNSLINDYKNASNLPRKKKKKLRKELQKYTQLKLKKRTKIIQGEI